MDCERFDKMSLELLYDELDELSSAATRRHLHHCTRCQGIWTRLKVTRELTVPPLEEPPADLFESIMQAEMAAHKQLPLRERFGRAVSILAGYAMRPQLAMAALLCLVIGSSLVFLRTTPNGQGRIGATEIGAPSTDFIASEAIRNPALVLGADPLEDGQFEPDEGRRKMLREAAPAEALVAEAAKLAPAPVSDKDSYREAMKTYQEGRYAEAERLFSEVAAAGGEKAAAAALHEAHAARNGSGCQRATALYDQVSARYAGSTVADEAAWQAAACYQALGQIERARAHYQALASRPAYAARATQAFEKLSPTRAEAESAQVAAAAAPAAAAKSAEQPAASSAGASAPADATESEPAPPAAPTPSSAPK